MSSLPHRWRVAASAMNLVDEDDGRRRRGSTSWVQKRHARRSSKSRIIFYGMSSKNPVVAYRREPKRYFSASKRTLPHLSPSNLIVEVEEATDIPTLFSGRFLREGHGHVPLERNRDFCTVTDDLNTTSFAITVHVIVQPEQKIIFSNRDTMHPIMRQDLLRYTSQKWSDYFLFLAQPSGIKCR